MMATTPEGEVKDMIKQRLALLGSHPAGSKMWETGKATSWYYMPVQNGMGVSGIPDFIGCHYGMFWSIEAKAPGKQPNPNQAQRMHEIRATAGQSWTVDCEDDMEEIVQWMYQVRRDPMLVIDAQTAVLRG